MYWSSKPDQYENIESNIDSVFPLILFNSWWNYLKPKFLLMFANCIEPSRRPHPARRPLVWDLCSKHCYKNWVTYCQTSVDFFVRLKVIAFIRDILQQLFPKSARWTTCGLQDLLKWSVDSVRHIYSACLVEHLGSCQKRFQVGKHRCSVPAVLKIHIHILTLDLWKRIK